MLTVADLATLKLGDKFNMGKVFPALTSKGLKWEFVERDNKGLHTFVVTYFGVFFGCFILTADGDKLKVKEV